jgi:hypothetical protein
MPALVLMYHDRAEAIAGVKPGKIVGNFLSRV